MTTEKTSSPRRSGADWFGLIAFAALVICSAVLVVRLISTKFLPTGQLLLAAGALLVLSGLHGWVQLLLPNALVSYALKMAKTPWTILPSILKVMNWQKLFLPSWVSPLLIVRANKMTSRQLRKRLMPRRS